MTTPAARREAAGQVSETMGLSERRACRVVGVNRSTARYTRRRRQDGALVERLRTLNVVDDFTRECRAIEVDTSLSGRRVTRVLERLVRERGMPGCVVADNGGVRRRAVDQWAYARGLRLEFIDPGRPTQNASIESFNGKFRDEFLNRELLDTLLEARVLTARWRQEYNTFRPHSSLNYRPPAPEAFEPLPVGPDPLHPQVAVAA